MSMTLGDRVVGLTNNGFPHNGDDTMMEVINVNDDTKKFDGKVIAKKGTVGWKKINGQISYGLPMDKFRAALVEETNEAFPAKITKAKIDEKYLLGNAFFVTKRIDGTIESNFNYTKNVVRESNSDRIDCLEELIAQYNKSKEAGTTWSLIKEIRQDKYTPINDMFSEENMVSLMDQFIKFFIEFKYTPSLRFMNTLSRIVGTSGVSDGLEYINNYFTLCNSTYRDKISEKLKSPEAKNLLTQLTIFTPSDDNVVNKRLVVWFGSPGAGKTHNALIECENRCVVCNGGTLPDDLLQDFKFEDGKPSFGRSALRDAMENGKKICLDEFNLLPMETIRFIQGILDNKDEIIYKGEVIKIKEGFCVYATMNLVVNSTVFGLTDALVDRANEIKEYTMTGKKLISALL